MNSQRSHYILVGPEDKARLREIGSGLAPRLDYRLVAESLNATIGGVFPTTDRAPGPQSNSRIAFSGPEFSGSRSTGGTHSRRQHHLLYR